MLKINEELSKSENIMVEIKPQIKNEQGEWIENKSYKLELLSGEVRKITPKNGGEPFEMVSYTFNIFNEDGTITKGVYELPKTNRNGELNYQIKRMIELGLDVGDIILLGTDEKGYISISKIGSDSVDSIPVIESDEQIDIKDIPF
jgi:hypothetical protein